MVSMNHKTMMIYNQGLITDSDQRKLQGQYSHI